jgi:GNAT superfamily N-acetyltransferase
MSITLETNVVETPRVIQIRGMFDIQQQTTETTIIHNNIPDLTEKEWNIGLIVGASGTGKSTIAKKHFHKLLDPEVEWQNNALIDNFSKEISLKEIVATLTSVGLSSPPMWLRSFQTLSTGEKFRANTARLLLEHSKLVAIDEFTSVVDRTVAQIASSSIAKTVRKRNQKLVAVSCHYDIIEWLQPDWIYEPQSGQFIWRSLQPRPNIQANIIKVDKQAWQLFARYHYLDHNLNISAQCYLATINETPAVFCAILPLPHPKLKNAFRVSRIVTLPDFQGVGIGSKVLKELASAYKARNKTLYITTSHPTMIKSLNNSVDWKMNRKPSRVQPQGTSGKAMKHMKPTSLNRITASFSYCGKSNIIASQLI